MRTRDAVIFKLTSGRFILTVIAGGVFAFAVWERILPDAAISAIVVSVFSSYFSRTDRQKGGTDENH